MINGIRVNGPLFKGIIGGSVGGGAGGFVGNTASALLSGENLSNALQSGLDGLKFGSALGALAGGPQGYKYAKQNGMNPFSGKLLDQPGATVVRHHTSQQAMSSIKDSQEIRGNVRDSGYGFQGPDFEGTSNIDINQNYGNSAKGAFVELRLSNDLLVPYPSPNRNFSNYFRVNTGGANFIVNPGYNPQYYRNFKLW